MSCLRPIKIKVDNPYRNDIIEVPCGTCAGCLKKRQNDWMVRMYYEFMEHSNNCFFTLTYSPENVPFSVDISSGLLSHTVYKKHLQDALKRFRHNVNKSFKYFICAEYGPKTFRPHYHGIFFGLSTLDSIEFFRDWQKNFGYTDSKDVSFGQKSFQCSARYVSKYAAKGIFENVGIRNFERAPVFRLVSKGLGLSYITKNREHYFSFDVDKSIRRSFVRIGDCSYGLPRYYKNKLYENFPFLQVKVSKALFAESLSIRLQKQTELQSLYSLPPDEAYYLVLRQEVLENTYKECEYISSLNQFYKQSIF